MKGLKTINNADIVLFQALDVARYAAMREFLIVVMS